MSMWLELAKLTPADLEKVRADPQRLDPVFFEEEGEALDELDPEADVFGTDYRTLSAIAEAMEIDLDDGESWLSRATGNGIGSELAFDFTYGPGFLLTPDEVQQVAAGLSAEGWADAAAVEDDDENLPGLLRFFTTAAKQKRGIVGGVS
jgi:hypothetical protein